MTISVKWAFFEKSQTQNLSNCIKAYTQIPMFLENSDQDIGSDYNSDLRHYRIFGHAKKVLIRKRFVTGLKKFHPLAATQKFHTRQ
jgi:hypothetical protein